MKSLTLLFLQAFCAALLFSPALTHKRGATLDGLVKALGSMYQKNLYSRDSGDFKALRSKYAKRNSAPGVLETVTFPREHICMTTLPYCVTFYSTLIVQPKPLITEKRSYGTQAPKACFSDITFGACKEEYGLSSLDNHIDVSSLKINDFCLPGVVEASGTLGILKDLPESTEIYIERNWVERPGFKTKYRQHDPDECINGGDLCQAYEMCKLLMADDCSWSWKGTQDGSKYPCTCPIPADTYNMEGYKKTVPAYDETIGFGKMGGFVLISATEVNGCFSFNVTVTEPAS